MCLRARCSLRPSAWRGDTRKAKCAARQCEGAGARPSRERACLWVPLRDARDAAHVTSAGAGAWPMAGGELKTRCTARSARRGRHAQLQGPAKGPSRLLPSPVLPCVRRTPTGQGHSTSGRVRSGRAASEAASQACPCRCGVAASLALMRRFRRLPWHHSAAKRAGGRRSPTRDQCRWVAAHVAHTLYGSGRAAGEPGSVCCARTGTCTARHQGQQASSGVASASDEDDQFGRRQRGLSFLLRVVRRSSGTGCRERFSGKGARQLGQGVREVGDGTEGSGKQLLRSTCAASGGEHVQAHRVVAAAARGSQPHAHPSGADRAGNSLAAAHLRRVARARLVAHGALLHVVAQRVAAAALGAEPRGQGSALVRASLAVEVRASLTPWRRT